MGKKRLRRSYRSAGINKNVSNDTLKAVARDRSEIWKETNKILAWRKGKNPWITIQNTERKTNRPYIRVRANTLYGDPKKMVIGIYSRREKS